jgi:ribosome biogenesis GTPase
MPRNGLVVARFRRHVAVEDDSGRQFLCLTRSRSLQPLVGDRVLWESQDDGSFVVAALQERESCLTRSDARGRCEPVAANVTQLVIVAALEPRPDWHLIDRYLAAAELLPARAIIVINKCDLAHADLPPLRIYRDIGYRVILTSAKRRIGLEELAAAMLGERSVFVGQSGAGKSSLTNALLGEPALALGAVTAEGKQGRHTTTTAALLRLRNGAELIDSPGVRSYAPYLDDPHAVVRGFKEFEPFVQRCRFVDCRHDVEPGCAVKAAVEAGAIARERYASYVKLRTVLESLRDS